MLDLVSLREKMINSPLYLASKKLSYTWKRKENGHIVCLLDGTGKRGKLAVFTAIGAVSEAHVNVDGVGGWRSNFTDGLEKAKFSFMLEKPEGTVFAADWDRQIEAANRIQMSICDNTKSRYFIATDASGKVLRFSKPVFEKKKDTDTVAIWPMEWSVPMDCQEMFNEVCKSHHIRPLVVYNEDNEEVTGSGMKEALVGSLVEVSFALKHYTMKDHEGNPYDSFTATVVAITVLQAGGPDDFCDFVTARDIRDAANMEDINPTLREDSVATMDGNASDTGDVPVNQSQTATSVVVPGANAVGTGAPPAGRSSAKKPKRRGLEGQGEADDKTVEGKKALDNADGFDVIDTPEV